MKELYVKDLLDQKGTKNNVVLYGWVKDIRHSKNYDFIDVVDSTGKISVIAEKGKLDEIDKEYSVKIEGSLKIEENNHIILNEIEIIGKAEKLVSPCAHSTFDIFDNRYANNVTNNKHLYIRNEKEMAILRARHIVLKNIRLWFEENGYTEVTAPILTPSILYGKETAITANWNNGQAFLTQCVGFYLESAVHAFEKVYNIGPSFRGMESVSPRHLMEYWHIKSEFAFCEFEEFFTVTESLVKFVADRCYEECQEQIKTLGCNYNGVNIKIPFPRITYDDAISLLNENGIKIEYGKSLNTASERFLSKYFDGCVWVVYNPRVIEGFPYKIKKDREDLSITADLICSNGYGELLGIADKITDVDEFDIRLAEKGKSIEDYNWFRELRTYGAVPHCGMGMGVERLIRWLFDLNHVRDAMPFPRRIGKKIYP